LFLPLNRNLENMMEERTDELYQTIDKHNKSVSELDRFVYCASHDLSAPFQLLITDRQRLKVVLHNLISNSVKYADSNKPNSYVKIHYQQDQGNSMILIEDNGIGSQSEQEDKIFEMFYRGSEKSKGSGLGLFIVKETLSVIGGNINVKIE